ncbi:hypothetical protein ACFV3R_16345 [Streptomyces sp. NPDC059740]|uniref:hypothetical protein n=1 Tax=Streptomyces sp. NPDC059740 TaxID=3346926 RepID=UPI00365785FD
MSEIAGIPATSSGPHPTPPQHGHPHPDAHEAYSFACMRCGHGWEQAYDIEHHVDAEGHTTVVYIADGVRVPSPLTRPTCQNCDGHLVRIMRAGRVDAASQASTGGLAAAGRKPVVGGRTRGKTAPGAPASEQAGEAPGREPGSTVAADRRPHRHLSDLFHALWEHVPPHHHRA